MYIVPDFRKQGIAKQLCLFLKSVAKMREWGRIDFVVLKNNEAAIKLYEGFEDIKEIDFVKHMRVDLALSD